jgi:hypothetical protein
LLALTNTNKTLCAEKRSLGIDIHLPILFGELEFSYQIVALQDFGNHRISRKLLIFSAKDESM